MIKFAQCPAIDAAVQKKLNNYAVDERPKRWEGKARAVLEFKSEVLKQGLVIQSEQCAWCTLPIGEKGRRTAHRDHIAPKAKYPLWTFLPKNIVIACEYCNGFAVKGDIDTVASAVDAYDECAFYLVHPYLDEPSEHLSFVCDADGTKVVIESQSGKGSWTIEKLKLDTPGATMERAKSHLYRQRLSDLSAQDGALFSAALAV